MKITIESTGRLVPRSDVPGDHFRVWRGVSAGGVPCLVLVSLLANENDADRAAMEPELATLQDRGDEALGVAIFPSKGTPS